MKYYLLLFFTFLFHSFSSQIKKDTTFTVKSEFNKNIGKYPLLNIVEVENNPNIERRSNIVYKSTERNLLLDAFINKKKGKLPAVILIHGGGWKSGSKEMQSAMAEKIATSGFQTFTIEYCLSDEAKYPAGINDILEAIDYIKKNAPKFKLDSTKIAILGCSSGAQMASLIATKFPGKINAVINIDGILAFHHPDSEEGKVAASWLGGSYDEIPEIWNEASALSHVSSKTPPFLFIHSQFKRFNAGRDDFIKKLDSFKIYSQVESIENSPHAFWLFEPWFSQTSQYIINFLNLNFKKR